MSGRWSLHPLTQYRPRVGTVVDTLVGFYHYLWETTERRSHSVDVTRPPLPYRTHHCVSGRGTPRLTLSPQNPRVRVLWGTKSPLSCLLLDSLGQNNDLITHETVSCCGPLLVEYRVTDVAHGESPPIRPSNSVQLLSRFRTGLLEEKRGCSNIQWDVWPVLVSNWFENSPRRNHPN